MEKYINLPVISKVSELFQFKAKIFPSQQLKHSFKIISCQLTASYLYNPGSLSNMSAMCHDGVHAPAAAPLSVHHHDMPILISCYNVFV